ncbi:hypothetical protein CLF_109743 [Clonorchis sinensis]|uniref:Uncharacterized protein n=1 Tax=Clonorchis sinensis TaxID=79923 RepID=G7YJR4_CLOSI|nr:hypothetical protein CLF_109743 [Clonorchis sinensis]
MLLGIPKWGMFPAGSRRFRSTPREQSNNYTIIPVMDGGIIAKLIRVPASFRKEFHNNPLLTVFSSTIKNNVVPITLHTIRKQIAFRWTVMDNPLCFDDDIFVEPNSKGSLEEKVFRPNCVGEHELAFLWTNACTECPYSPWFSYVAELFARLTVVSIHFVARALFCFLMNSLTRVHTIGSFYTIHLIQLSTRNLSVTNKPVIAVKLLYVISPLNFVVFCRTVRNSVSQSVRSLRLFHAIRSAESVVRNMNLLDRTTNSLSDEPDYRLRESALWITYIICSPNSIHWCLSTCIRYESIPVLLGSASSFWKREDRNAFFIYSLILITLSPPDKLETVQWLRPEHTDWQVHGSNPTPAQADQLEWNPDILEEDAASECKTIAQGILKKLRHPDDASEQPAISLVNECPLCRNCPSPRAIKSPTANTPDSHRGQSGINKAKALLSDTTTYRHIENHQSKNLENEISRKLKKAQELQRITREEYWKMRTQDPAVPRFYGLSEVHRDDTTTSRIAPGDSNPQAVEKTEVSHQWVTTLSQKDRAILR